MPITTTVGFEAEFQTDVGALTRALHAIALVGMREPHSWHCDCESCDFGEDFPAFRAQRDSSCGGEVISNVINVRNGEMESRWLIHLNTLQGLAFDLDAEPGLDAGCHVHVKAPRARAKRGLLVRTFIQWEEVLTAIAAGRWQRQRGANAMARDRAYSPVRSLDYSSVESFCSDDQSDDDLALFYDLYSEQDRHSNLNAAASRYGTIEFRLWNSTRVAWRFELFCLLSATLTDMDVIAKMAASPPRFFSTDANHAAAIVRLISILEHKGYDRCAELLSRQTEYMHTRAADAPSTFTTLAGAFAMPA